MQNYIRYIWHELKQKLSLKLNNPAGFRVNPTILVILNEILQYCAIRNFLP